MGDQNQKNDSRPMTAEERGRKGGETTAREHPSQYSEMGKKARQQRGGGNASDDESQSSRSFNSDDGSSEELDTNR